MPEEDNKQPEEEIQKPADKPAEESKVEESAVPKDTPPSTESAEIKQEAPQESPSPEAPKSTPEATATPGTPTEKAKSPDIKSKITHEVGDIFKDVKDFSMEDVKNLDIHSSKGHHFLIIIICASLFVIVLFLGVYSFLLEPSYGPNSMVACKIERGIPLKEACEDAGKCKEFDRSEAQEMNKYIQEGYVNCTPFKVKPN